MRILFPLAFALLAGPGLPAHAESLTFTQIARARANYQAILNGAKTFNDLTLAEREEIRELDRRIRAQEPPDTRTAFERCQDAEYARLGRAPSDLDKRVIDTRCR